MGVKRALAEAALPAAHRYVRRGRNAPLRALLARRLLEPALRGAPRPFTTTTDAGFAMAGTTADMIQRYVYMFGVWEPDLTAWMRSRPLAGRTVVDVGANVGYFALLASRLVGPAGGVVAVEASPSTFAGLLDNLARNDAKNVRPLHAAAAAAPGTVRLFAGDAHNSGTATVVPRAGAASVEVAAVRLADVLGPDEVSSARLVKIDVEGAELGVLEGLAPVLPAMAEDVELAVEVSPADIAAAGRDVGELFALLGAHGFVAYRLPTDYSFGRYAARRAPSPPRRLREPLTERSDLVFSRVESEVLA